MTRSDQDDFDLDTEFAARSVGALAIEVEDMLARFPRINTTSLRDHPHELLALSRTLSATRSALLDLEQSVREASPAPLTLDIGAAA